VIKFSLSADSSRECRCLIILMSAAFVWSLLSCLPEAANAQTPSSTVKAKGQTAAMLTSDGQPDLQGIWDFGSITPMQRPPEFAGKEFLTEQEAADWAAKKMKELDFDRRDGGAEANIARGYNEYWTERGAPVVTRRTSLVIDPPDGRIPATEQTLQRQKEDRERYLNPRYDGPEDLSLAQRCLNVGGYGPPISPTLYNNNVRITQGPGYVMILHEMNHDTRVIPLDGRPHLPEQIRLWDGDSRGHWEGDTLVVDTTNFNDEAGLRERKHLHLIERFKRINNEILQYRFTVDDPTSYTRPWTAEIPARKTEGPIIEYACHEGNDTMMNALSEARAEEKKASAQSPTK